MEGSCSRSQAHTELYDQISGALERARYNAKLVHMIQFNCREAQTTANCGQSEWAITSTTKVKFLLIDQLPQVTKSFVINTEQFIFIKTCSLNSIFYLQFVKMWNQLSSIYSQKKMYIKIEAVGHDVKGR